MLSLLYKIALLGSAAYLAIAALLYLVQDRLIFHPQPPGPVPPRAQAQPTAVVRPDVTLHGWIVNPQGAGPLLIYFGGNAETLAPLVEPFARLAATTVLISYRGYEHSGGEPSAAALIEDAAAVTQTMRRRLGEERPLILFGRSLGSGIAVLTARSTRPDGVILLSPYRSLESLARRAAPLLPVRVLLRHRIDAAAHAHALPRQVLVLYGEADLIIPAAESRAFLAALPAPQVVTFDGGHNVPLTQPRLWTAVRDFVHASR